MNNIIFVAIVLAACSFALNIILLVRFTSLTYSIQSIGICYGNLLKATEDLSRINENGNNIVKGIWETYQTMHKLQEKTNEQCDNIKKCNDLIIEQYHHIYDAFKLCEERYSDIYDQWSEMTARYEDIKSAIDELKPTEETDEFAKRRDMAIDMIRKAQEKVGA